MFITSCKHLGSYSHNAFMFRSPITKHNYIAFSLTIHQSCCNKWWKMNIQASFLTIILVNNKYIGIVKIPEVSKVVKPRDDAGSLPDSKFHGANMGSTWVLSAPDGPHVGPMNLAIRDCLEQCLRAKNTKCRFLSSIIALKASSRASVFVVVIANSSVELSIIAASPHSIPC